MLAENIYQLRKKARLSQEQLAERLQVSRQAVSKWESGASVPESEKLVAISRFFQVSLDELMGEDTPKSQGKESLPSQPSNRMLVGFLLCLCGALCLIFWGLGTIVSPEVSQQISESSTVTIDGNGLLLTVSTAALAIGTLILLRKN